ALAGHVVGDADRRRLDLALTAHEYELDAQELVEHQSLARNLVLVDALRDVDAVQRGTSIDEVEAVEHPVGHGILDLAGAAQRLLDPLPELPGRELRLLRLRIDRHDATGAVADEVDDRVRHLLAPLEHVELAEEHGLRSFTELLLSPGLVEERAAQVAGPVGHVDLHDGAP